MHLHWLPGRKAEPDNPDCHPSWVSSARTSGRIDNDSRIVRNGLRIGLCGNRVGLAARQRQFPSGVGSRQRQFSISVTSAAILVPGCIPSESVETSQAQFIENTVSIGDFAAISEVCFILSGGNVPWGLVTGQSSNGVKPVARPSGSELERIGQFF